MDLQGEAGAKPALSRNCIALSDFDESGTAEPGYPPLFASTRLRVKGQDTACRYPTPNVLHSELDDAGYAPSAASGRVPDVSMRPHTRIDCSPG
jgi:hypothetical protein